VNELANILVSLAIHKFHDAVHRLLRTPRTKLFLIVQTQDRHRKARVVAEHLHSPFLVAFLIRLLRFVVLAFQIISLPNTQPNFNVKTLRNHVEGNFASLVLDSLNIVHWALGKEAATQTASTGGDVYDERMFTLPQERDEGLAQEIWSLRVCVECGLEFIALCCVRGNRNSSIVEEYIQFAMLGRDGADGLAYMLVVLKVKLNEFDAAGEVTRL
jgi:hypothetical protein